MAINNWIEEVLQECEGVETPRSWLYWSVICTIAAAAGNNYFLKAFGGNVTYKPNLYVILLGDSGLGKAYPVTLAKNLVEKADVTRVIYGRSSIQAIVKELSQAKSREKKEPLVDSRGFIINGELSTAIIQDPDSLTILTDIYDPHETWTNKLKGDGNEVLKDTATTCLFGSSPAHFYNSIPQVNIEGGYIGRNLVVYEEARYKDLDMFTEDDDIAAGFPYKLHVPFLEGLAAKGGRLIPDSDSKALLNTWRRKWREAKHEDTTGFTNRVPDHIVKTAMCLCLADYSQELVIRPRHMEEAIEKITALVYSSARAASGMGLDPLAKQTRMVLDYLVSAENNEMTRKKLLVKGYGNYDPPMLDRILESLAERDWIIKIKVPSGRYSDWNIRLHGEPLEQYKKFIKNKEDQKNLQKVRVIKE